MALAKAEFTISIRPVSSLRPHEETIPSHVKELAAEMKREGVQRDPLIIDRESSAVLDGMHRLAAFSELGIENAVCCALDYSSKAVTLGRWARAYSRATAGPLERDLPFAAQMKKSKVAEAFDSLEGRKAGFAVLTRDVSLLSDWGAGLSETARAVREMDDLAERKGWRRSFVPEDEIDVPLQEPTTMVVLLRRITKEEVVTAARSGALFPCKTSMHVIDPRPVAVNFPIADLDSTTTEELRARLKGKGEFLAPPNSEYKGRRYKERLLFLDRS